ncbi:MAG: hypothetical protein ACD_76C00057G0005 [uncultured bacterium]|nr:MAG: hypothetical protein ACD_76C00057G0005 [uncultured bacterium]HBD05655.1 hypothetical protein [Candidatus Uhrbacteria bacterium]
MAESENLAAMRAKIEKARADAAAKKAEEEARTREAAEQAGAKTESERSSLEQEHSGAEQALSETTTELAARESDLAEAKTLMDDAAEFPDDVRAELQEQFDSIKQEVASIQAKKEELSTRLNNLNAELSALPAKEKPATEAGTEAVSAETEQVKDPVGDFLDTLQMGRNDAELRTKIDNNLRTQNLDSDSLKKLFDETIQQREANEPALREQMNSSNAQTIIAILEALPKIHNLVDKLHGKPVMERVHEIKQIAQEENWKQSTLADELARTLQRAGLDRGKLVDEIAKLEPKKVAELFAKLIPLMRNSNQASTQIRENWNTASKVNNLIEQSNKEYDPNSDKRKEQTLVKQLPHGHWGIIEDAAKRIQESQK